MASSLMFLLLTVMVYGSAAETIVCSILGCSNYNVLAAPAIVEQCKRLSCNLPQMGPLPLTMDFPQKNPQYPAYYFIPPHIRVRIESLDNLLNWATQATRQSTQEKLFKPNDLKSWKIMVNRIKNETNIQAENWLLELERWLNLNKDIKDILKHVSAIISENELIYTTSMDTIRTSIVPELFHWLKVHLQFSPPPQTRHNIPNPFFPGLSYPPQLQPFMPQNFDQFGFPIQTLPYPLHPGHVFPQPPTPTICKPVNNPQISKCEKIKVTFDVLVGNRSRCNAHVVEPVQKVKNMLILASHSFACLAFSTAQRSPSDKNPNSEYLYSVDGIAETNDNKWVIYLKRTGQHIDLNNYLPSDGDYFYIDYASS